MKRSFLVGCLFIILLFSLGCNSSADNTKYIDFKKTVPVATTAVIPKDNNALRVAIASVLLPQDTVVHYRAISDYLGNKLGRQIILVQKKQLCRNRSTLAKWWRGYGIFLLWWLCQL